MVEVVCSCREAETEAEQTWSNLLLELLGVVPGRGESGLAMSWKSGFRFLIGRKGGSCGASGVPTSQLQNSWFT